MGKYVFLYTGGSRPESEAESNEVMGKWQAFFGGLGGAVVDVGAPFGESRNVNGKGASGYSIVDAASLDAAAEMAKACPIYERGGNVEIYETLEM